MSVATVATEPRSVELPADLQSPRAKLVYLYLATTGSATPDELSEALDMGKMALFSVLGSLDEQGLVDAAGDRYETA